MSAIVNARPLVPVSTDPDSPVVLTPATLLTQKPQELRPPVGDFSAENLLSKQWKPIQHLANAFLVAMEERVTVHVTATKKVEKHVPQPAGR